MRHRDLPSQDAEFIASTGGVSPWQGRLTIGGGRVVLAPFRLERLRFIGPRATPISIDLTLVKVARVRKRNWLLRLFGDLPLALEAELELSDGRRIRVQSYQAPEIVEAINDRLHPGDG